MKNNAEPLILGIDLGGTKILTAVVDSRGKILSRDRSTTPADRGPEAVIRAIVASSKHTIDQAGITAAELTAIGLGAPGLSNPETGVLFTSPNLPDWQDVPLRDIIKKELGVKTFLINDANAAALGELYFGAATGATNFIYVTISTGIGGGIVIDRQIYTGASGLAGEIGHMTIDDDGPLCHCGNRGCWESLASGTALAQEARQWIEQGAGAAILALADGILENVTAETIHRAAQAGDNLAKEIITRSSYYVGVGLANLINLFSPELIVIGGGLSNIGDMLFEPAYEVARNRAFKESYQAVRFALAELGGDSGVIGAAIFARQKTEETDRNSGGNSR